MSRGLTGWHPKRALELTHLLCDGVDSAVPLATAPSSPSTTLVISNADA